VDDARKQTTHGTFGLSKELGIIREVLDDPEACGAGDDGGEPLEDEDPRPRGFAGDTVHVRDGSRKQTAEGAGNGRGGEEERRAEAELGALVPAERRERVSGSGVCNGRCERTRRGSS
jgi:hypothetical protein